MKRYFLIFLLFVFAVLTVRAQDNIVLNLTVVSGNLHIACANCGSSNEVDFSSGGSITINSTITAGFHFSITNQSVNSLKPFDGDVNTNPFKLTVNKNGTINTDQNKLQNKFRIIVAAVGFHAGELPLTLKAPSATDSNDQHTTTGSASGTGGPTGAVQPATAVTISVSAPKFQVTGIPIVDAITLRKLMDKTCATDTGARRKILMTLTYYTSNTEQKRDLVNGVDPTSFFTAEGNKYIQDYLLLAKDAIESCNIEAQSGNSSISMAGNALSAVGNLDVTNLADGFAKFLVKRAKEELSAAFFSRFQEFISKPEYSDVRTLFPSTYSVLNVIGAEIYNYNAYLNSLREAFEKDLNSLLKNMPKVIEDGRYKSFFDAQPNLKAICLSSLYIGDGLMNKEQPGKIIEDYPEDYKNTFTNQTVKGSIELLQLFSKSLRSSAGADYWASADTMNILVNDTQTFKIYLGLLYEQGKDITIAAGIKFSKVLTIAHDSLPKVKAYITGLVKQIKTVRSDIQNVIGSDKKNIAFQEYYNYYNSTLDLIEYGSQVYKLPLLSSLKPDETFNSYLQILRTGGDLAFDINKKNFSSAVLDAFKIYEFVTGGSKEGNKQQEDYATQKINDFTKMKDTETRLSAPDPQKTNYYTTQISYFTNYKSMVQNQESDKNSKLGGTVENIKNFVLKYGTFMAAIVQAQNSDDVEAAIESMALPAGSCIKRESACNVSLNAYAGFFAGHENINSSGVNNSNNINNSGVTAPIGISASIGRRKFFGFPCNDNNEGHWSYSFFLSVIDLGAIASYRFNDDNTTQAIPSIQLKDIISPGLFISFGIPKCPLSINAGWQIGSNLRKIDTNSTDMSLQNDYSNKVYWRASISVCVDIPLLNFANRQDRKSDR